MYLNFYGLKEKPFSVTPDTSFLFKSRPHSEAFNHLLYGIQSRAGFILITGDIGTGKTTLCRALLNELRDKTHSALIFNPRLTEIELLQTILQELGIKHHHQSKKELLDLLNQFLLSCSKRGETVVIIIDEAQNLNPALLEEIRLLSNLETEKEKLLQIILVGQSELQEKLKFPSLQQLNQRISVRYHLHPLEKDEIERYINHRLIKAGSAGDICFTSRALRLIYDYSQGIPRLINLICDKALLAGYIAQKKNIDTKMVFEALTELGMASPTFIFNSSLKPIPTFTSIIILFLFILSIIMGLEKSILPHVQMPARFAEAKIPENLIKENRFLLSGYPSNIKEASLNESNETDETLSILLKIWGIKEERKSQKVAHWKNEAWKLNFPERIKNFDLEATQFKSDLETLQRLNYPCMVQLRNKGNPDKYHYAALIKLNTEMAIIVDPLKGRIKMPLSEFESLWTRHTIVLWRNFDGINRELKPGIVAPEIRVLKRRFMEIGLLKDYQPDEKFDKSLEDAVKIFQKSFKLRDDGIVGSLTKMALYRSLPFLRLPELKTKSYESD